MTSLRPKSLNQPLFHDHSLIAIRCILGEMLSGRRLISSATSDEDRIIDIVSLCGDEQEFPKTWTGLPGYPHLGSFVWDSMHDEWSLKAICERAA